jgi:DNA-binding NarL/FixJ family response regulator
MKFPPACMFPTTTLFLDDEEEFLACLERGLSREQTLFKGFTCPKNAKDYLEAFRPHQAWKSSWLKTAPSENNFENLSIEVQFSNILEAIFDPQRFNEITTIAVDYQMPGINGLEFLKAFSDIPAKKVLLTGIADANIAIEAMEMDLIDSYIKKHDRHFVNRIKNAINKHRILYFEDMSSVINESINLVKQSEALEKSYCELIENIRLKHHATEYYLMDQNGSYIFVDQADHRLDLLIKSREQLESELDAVRDQINSSKEIFSAFF